MRSAERALDLLDRSSRQHSEHVPQPVCRAILADREPLFLSAMSFALGGLDDVSVESATTQSRVLLETVRNLQPSVVVAGFVLGCGRDMLGIVTDLKLACPSSSVVVLLPASTATFAAELRSRGVSGILARTATPETLRRGVRAVMQGQTFVDPGLLSASPGSDSTVSAMALGRLTSRELEVFRLFGESRTYKDIAATLCISPRTVESHRDNIRAKLEISSAKSFTLAARAYVIWEATSLDHLA